MDEKGRGSPAKDGCPWPRRKGAGHRFQGCSGDRMVPGDSWGGGGGSTMVCPQVCAVSGGTGGRGLSAGQPWKETLAPSTLLVRLLEGPLPSSRCHSERQTLPGEHGASPALTLVVCAYAGGCTGTHVHAYTHICTRTRTHTSIASHPRLRTLKALQQPTPARPAPSPVFLSASLLRPIKGSFRRD